MPRVLARVNHPKNEWLFTEQWGVDAAVSPPHILTAMVEEAVTVGDLVQLIRLEGGRISIVEMTLPDASPAVGQPLYELRLPPDSAVVAILRDGHVVIPQPETVFVAGDEVVALSPSREHERALRDAVVGRLAASPTGRSAASLGRELQPGIDHLRVPVVLRRARLPRRRACRAPRPSMPRRPMNPTTTSPVPSETAPPATRCPPSGRP